MQLGSPLARLLLATLLTLVLGEGLVRALAHEDSQGQTRVLGYTLSPRRIPLRQIGESIALYRATDDSFLVHDPLLGWAPRPAGRSRGGLLRANRDGLRADREYSLEPAPGVLRIEVFGDSFTFGDEVPVEQSWPALLEERLRERGIAAEVLNFGVNAYGLDQAYLRWKHAGRRFRPAVVVYGFQPENLVRNLNVFRPLYFAGTEIPLSKPRFVLSAGGGLELRNSPTLAPELVPAALAAIADHPLRPYEVALDHRYDDRWWLHSKLAALIAALLDRMRETGRDPIARLGAQPEAQELAARLLRRFVAEVAADGASFVAVLLPRREDLEAAATGTATAAGGTGGVPPGGAATAGASTAWYAPALHALEAQAPLVRPEASFLPLRDGDFQPGGHYGPRLGALVAEALVDPLTRISCERSTGPATTEPCRRWAPP